ncbi:hypothetical protein ABMA27_006260 [Loxostege sticticalis]|uniref:MADF domain-containing protein n=1 Tax=Loxostege sticticalis TaxID=481309 RepID=A0ABR3HI66_LOXSC
MEEDSDSYSEPLIEDIEFVEASFLPDTNDKLILKKFISKMESLPVLWDSTCPDYSNTKKRQKAMGQLVVIYRQIKPSAKLDDVRKKINSLRSNYRKELRKIENSKLSAESEEDVYKPSSWVFYAMQFLNSTMSQPGTASSSNNHQETQDDQYQPASKKIRTVSVPMTKQNPAIKTKHAPQSGNTQSLSYNTASQSGSTQSQSCNTQSQSGYTQSQSGNTQSHACNLSHPACNTQPVNPTALYWSQKLDSIKDPIQKLYAEKYINEILFEAQLGNLSGAPAIQIVSSLDNQAVVSNSTQGQVQKNKPSTGIQIGPYTP